jgi:hypothetical protein
MIRRSRDFLTRTDNINIVLALVGLGLAISVGFPLVIPSLDRGAVCTNLPSPQGGNNQSLLALSDGTAVPQEVELELEILNDEHKNGVGDVEIQRGEDLMVRVTFQNNDVGPVTLFFLEDREVVGNFDNLSTQQSIGLMFEFRELQGNSLLNETGVRQPPSQNSFSSYALEDLYMLSSKQKCYIDIRFSASRLEQLGLFVYPEYRIRAYYRNSSRGVPLPPLAAPTATPMFTDQGVWTGTIQSNEVRLITNLGG